MILHGGCQCGAVAFEVTGRARDVVACHCHQCRKTSGHYWAASAVAREDHRLLRHETLAWYRSSDRARRGFCGRCGSSLFWDEGSDSIHFAAGALDGRTGLRTVDHIHTVHAGDYYSPKGPPPAVLATDITLDCECLCRGVRFSLPGPAGDITACHCHQCRKISGHFSASFDADDGLIDWTTRDTLAEYRTAGGATRGFCNRCGSSLWFRKAEGGFSVEAGIVTGPTGGRLAGHIFVSEKGDYYELDDGLPQSGGW